MIQLKTMYADKASADICSPEVLYNAIILQAVKDFRSARRRMQRQAGDKAAIKTIREVSRFFHSRYFKVLSRVDGPTILRRLSEEK